VSKGVVLNQIAKGENLQLFVKYCSPLRAYSFQKLDRCIKEACHACGILCQQKFKILWVHLMLL
jgi:hypothetical protein